MAPPELVDSFVPYVTLCHFRDFVFSQRKWHLIVETFSFCLLFTYMIELVLTVLGLLGLAHLTLIRDSTGRFFGDILQISFGFR
jgi:hypothetical protein